MRTKKLHAFITYAILLLAISSPIKTAIASSGYVNIENIQITLTPLTPGATFTWTNANDRLTQRSEVLSSKPYQHDDHLTTTKNDWESPSGTASSTSGASASTSFTPSDQGPTILETANALIETVPLGSSLESSGAFAGLGLERSFTITGDMKIEFSFNYSMFADPGNGLTWGSTFAHISFTSMIWSDLFCCGDDSFPSYNLRDEIYAYSGVVPGTNDGPVSTGIVSSSNTWSFPFYTTLLHGKGDGDTYGWFEIDTSVQTTQYALPVPEPATYAMLLAGLGLMGFSFKRQAKNCLLNA